MFFNKAKSKQEQAPMIEPGQKDLIIWLEIGASDLDRAVEFYHNVFGISVQIKTLFNRRIGFFEKKNSGPGICIVERDELRGDNSIKPTFFVNIMHESIKKVISNGGKVIVEPAILKQENSKGETLIGANMIDDEIGYVAEVMDTEGNIILFYSHY